MPAERAPMRKVRKVLRLKHALGASERQIAMSVEISGSTVAEYLRRAAFPFAEDGAERPALSPPLNRAPPTHEACACRREAETAEGQEHPETGPISRLSSRRFRSAFKHHAR
jgi:hypothetical protein